VNKPVKSSRFVASIEQDTKQRILDASERLFMERGFSATSLREITSAAKVNLAAVNYHFGAKETLIEAVLTRRLQPLNELRVAELADIEAGAGKKGASIEAILTVFIAAAFKPDGDPTEGGSVFLRLLGRAFTEPSEQVRDILQRQYRTVAASYKRAFMRALPNLAEEELVWRMQFLFGAISYTMAGTNVMKLVASCDLSDANDRQAVTQRLVAFLAAGLKAPVPPKRASAQRRRSTK
jgi:AcrR family transcriptional regulator